MKYIFSTTTNYGDKSVVGFDFFATFDNVFALCDGANSCHNSGILAEKLSRKIVKNWASPSLDKKLRKNYLSAQIIQIHKELLLDNLDAASTLVALGVFDDFFEMISVGDSYGEVFEKVSKKKWEHFSSMPRDIDLNNNPFQLIGSEVLENVHYQVFPTKKTWCIFMMSDGLGNFVDSSDLLERLSLLGDELPNENDLDFIANDLAKSAFIRGSKDDISVTVIFLYSK